MKSLFLTQKVVYILLPSLIFNASSLGEAIEMVLGGAQQGGYL
jgi:hypothetical protein